MPLNLKVIGLPQMVSKLDFDRLVKPPVEDEIRDKVEERWTRRRRKGLGARRNTLMSEVEPMKATVTTTLRNPRTVGSAWQRALLKAGRAMLPRVVRKAIQRIEGAWAS